MITLKEAASGLLPRQNAVACPAASSHTREFYRAAAVHGGRRLEQDSSTLNSGVCRRHHASRAFAVAVAIDALGGGLSQSAAGQSLIGPLKACMTTALHWIWACEQTATYKSSTVLVLTRRWRARRRPKLARASIRLPEPSVNASLNSRLLGCHQQEQGRRQGQRDRRRGSERTSSRPSPGRRDISKGWKLEDGTQPPPA